MRCAQAVRKFVNQQYVALLQCGLHRFGRNVERPHDERDQEKRNEARNDERVEIFPDDGGCVRVLAGGCDRFEAEGYARDGEDADQPE
jgi:hypothetical protein